MNEELLSSMTFTPEKCEQFDLGDIQEFSFKTSEDILTKKDVVETYNRLKNSNREIILEGKISDESVANMYDILYKGTSIILGRTPWGGTLSMAYEVVKKLYPKKYREIVTKAERDYLDRLNESEDNTNV